MGDTNVYIRMNSKSVRSKWVAFFLALFFGGLGVHRFYVGKVGSGIFYLLTGGLMGIGVLVDLFVIAFGGFRDKEGAWLD